MFCQIHELKRTVKLNYKIIVLLSVCVIQTIFLCLISYKMQQQDNEYLYLESNVKRTHPDQTSNTLGNFITHLAKKYNLSGEWEVGLAEISYTKSYYNLVSDENISVYSFNNTEYESNALLISGHYKSVEDLLKYINIILSDIGKLHDLKNSYKPPQLIYSNSSRNVSIEIGYLYGTDKNPITLLLPKFSKRLNNILGLIDTQGNVLSFTNSIANEIFSKGLIDIQETDLSQANKLFDSDILIYIDKFKKDIILKKVLLEGLREVTFDSDIRTLFVYCNIIQPLSVEDVYAQLIRQVEIPNRVFFGEQVTVKYNHLYYIPLLFNEIDSIEIDIRDDSNHPIKFEFGKTSIVLHFRKRFNGSKSLYELLSESSG